MCLDNHKLLYVKPEKIGCCCVYNTSLTVQQSQEKIILTKSHCLSWSFSSVVRHKFKHSTIIFLKISHSSLFKHKHKNAHIAIHTHNPVQLCLLHDTCTVTLRCLQETPSQLLLCFPVKAPRGQRPPHYLAALYVSAHVGHAPYMHAQPASHA